MHKISLSILSSIFVFWAVFADTAQATLDSRSHTAALQETSANEVVDAFNVIYPDLNLSIAVPAKEAVLINELDSLRAILHRAPYNDGQLIHLACCSPACGNDKGCGKK
ncbi:MAG: hypothetical protein AB7N80_02355 [Bdellovibrionales bacterium]